MSRVGALAQELADDLIVVDQADYVRCVADWISRAGDVTRPAEITGTPLIDALVAAAASHVALRRGMSAPEWTNGHALDRFWHPGSPAFLAWSFAHAPAAFKCRGLLIEEESLVSV